MSLLRDLLKENGAAGATSAGDIAGAHGSLFGGGAVRQKPKPMKRYDSFSAHNQRASGSPMMRRMTAEGDLYGGGFIRFERIQKARFAALQRAMMFEDITGSTDFDVSDVISKLEAAEKKAKVEKDTTTFGLENENGGIVRVVVRQDQADEFEQALAQMLAGSDNNNDEENTSMEIAEVLFKLKDKYDIVDVDWGDIPEDEEQEQTVGGAAAGVEGAPAGGAAGGLPPPGGAAGGQPPAGGVNPIDQAAGEEGAEGEGEEGEGEGEMEAGEGEEDEKSALQSVISMMKADAKAKMAEANARAAEARAKEAEWTAKASASKVKQEEEVLDMETHEKEQREMDKEAKRLAKLAKYRHEKASKYGEELHSGEGLDDEGGGRPSADDSEEEEEGGNRFPYDPADKKRYGPSERKFNLKQLRDMIYAHLRGDEH